MIKKDTPEDLQRKAQNYMRYKKDPWAFITECVRTLDQVDAIDPIKAFPDKEYLQRFVRVYQKYPLLAIPKSRRMTMSWSMMALVAWEILFHKGKQWAFVSKKEDDANELILRVKFILENLNEDNFPMELLPKLNYKFNYIAFEDMNSRVRGFPQGADQLRQFTFSGIFGDESAFWEKAQEFYSASFPTIDGGGRMILVSSPAPGFFKRLCYDAMDEVGDIQTEEYEPDFVNVAQGIRIWQNRNNKFLVFELHYTADPGKRSEEYKESLKASMPLSDYMREYELHWDTFKGQPVYPEFQRDLHIIRDLPEPIPGLPMLIGFDFGLTPAAVIAQYEAGRLVIVKEYFEVNMGIERFLDTILPDIRMRWPTKSDLRKDWKCFIDPAGTERVGTDENCCAQVLSEKGFVPIPGPVSFTKRRLGVSNFLTTIGGEGPNFQIYARGCPMTTKGLEGGYRYDNKYVDREPGKVKPIKDQYSHTQDALQYIASGIVGVVTEMKRKIPRQRYIFNNKKVNNGRRYG